MQSPKTKVWQELQLLLFDGDDPTIEEINDIKTAVSEAVLIQLFMATMRDRGK